MLVSFLLLSIFFSVKNIAIGTGVDTDEHENNIIKKVTENGKDLSYQSSNDIFHYK